MLNQQKLEAFCLQQQLTGPAYQIIERIRKLPPSRRVNSRHNNVSCRFPSRKMGCVIQAESHGNELATIYLWEHDPRVHEFYDQPEPIKLSYVRGTRTISYQHTPDFFLIADHFVGWIECKLEEDLERLAKQHPERFQRLGDTWISPPGRTFAEQFGLDYAIRSSQENDWSLIKNLHFLQDYIDPSCPPVSEAQHAAAKTLFAKQSCYLLFDLLRANATLPPDAIYKMLVDGDLIADLSSGLLSNSTSFMVYADALAFDIFRQQRATASPLLGAQALSFDPGASLIWNGAAWRVGSCHQNHVDLISSKGEVQSLAWSSIEELLTRNELAAPTSTSHQKTQAWLSRKLMASSSLMLQQAWQRQQMAEGLCPTSPRSQRRFRKQYREAELTLGNGFIGLIDRSAEKGNRIRKLPARAIQLMHEVLHTHYLSDTNASLNTAYAELVIRCDEEGLTPPSIRTFSAERRRLLDPFKEKRIREGHKAAYNLQELVWTQKGGFAPHGERPFDVAHIDHTEVDLMMLGLADDEPQTKKTDRMWLSAMIDAFSRVVLAYYLSFDTPNYTNCMMLIRQCVKRHHRLPAVIVVDGGKDFASEYFEILLASLMITKKTRPPHCPRYGAVIERLFGIFNTSLWHNLRGNTKLLRDPRACSASHDPRKLAIWTLDRAETIFSRWLSEVYEVSVHSTLLAQPRQIFEAGLFETGAREHKRQPYNEAFLVQCLPLAKQPSLKIHPGRGVKHYGTYYWCEAFRQPHVLATKGVAFRYDPFDLSTAYAYIDGTWQRCRSRDMHNNENKTERQLRQEASALRHLRRQKGQYKLATARREGAFYRSLRKEELALIQEKAMSGPVVPRLLEPTPAQDSPAWTELPIYGDF